jgi:hypothetical protein
LFFKTEHTNVHFSTLNMQAAFTYETSETSSTSTWCNNPINIALYYVLIYNVISSWENLLHVQSLIFLPCRVCLMYNNNYIEPPRMAAKFKILLKILSTI